MIKLKRLIEMAIKWHKTASSRRRRITFLRSSHKGLHIERCNEGLVNKGHFVVYTTDDRRFVIPLEYLNTDSFRELFRMSEEEFGLPSDGPIILPCNSVLLEFIVSFVKGRTDLEKALLVHMATSLCSSSSSVVPEENNQQLLLQGF